MSSKERSKNGTGIHGKFYERGIALWTALRSLSDKSIEDFWILSNPTGVEKFDDIILHVEYKKGDNDGEDRVKDAEVYFFQLKHKENSGAPFRTCSLQNDKNFKLKNYETEYVKLTENENPFFENHNINENHKKFFCIYTNCVRTEDEEIVKSKFDLHLVQPGEINEISDSSSTNQSIYKVGDPEKECNEYFLNQFYLWLNQMNEGDIKSRISNEFRISITAVDSLVFYFVRRFEPPKNNEKLTRKEMIRKMLEIFVEDYTIPRQSFKENDKSLNVLCIIKSYNLTVIKHASSEQRIWSDIQHEIESEYEALQIGTALDVTKMIKEIYLELVCELRLPFFIKTSNPLFEFFQNNFLDAVRISVVIYSDDKRKLSLNENGSKVLEFLTDLTDELVDDLRKKNSINLPKLSFQGKEKVDLLEFVKDANKSSQQVDIDIFFKYLDKTIEIGRREYSPENYIKRKLYVPVMRMEEITSNESKKIICIQIFCNCSEKKGLSLGLTNVIDYIKRPKQKRKNMALNFFSVSPFTITLVEKLNSIKEGRRKHVHIFEKMHNSNIFIPVYREGYRECYVTRKLTSEPIDDAAIIDFCQQNKINIICNNAGEGKTILLKHISNNFPTDVWVVNINLGNASNLTSAKDFIVFMQEIYNLEKTNTREIYHDVLTKIYSICKEKKKFIYLVDDYEEIETPQFTKVLREVQRAGIRIWITSRPFKKSELEMDFGVNAMELIPITPEEQQSFFKNYFHTGNESVNTNEVLASISAIREKMNETFIGVFQQMTMLAEIFKSTKEMPKSKYEIIDVYEKFIELKIRSNKKKHHQDIFRLMMQKFALTHFFSDVALKQFFDIKELNAQLTFFKDEYQKGSIITYISEDNTAIFSHETYAEFLAAQWIAQKFEDGFILEQARNESNLENMREIMKLLYIQKLRTVRYFFDAILTRKQMMLSAAVNKNYEKMEQLYLKNTKDISQRDILGRTVLHFLIGNEPQYDIQTNSALLRQCNERNASFSVNEDFIFLSLPKRIDNQPKEHEQFETWEGFYKLEYDRGSNCDLFQLIEDHFFGLKLNQFILLSGSLALLDRLLANEQLKIHNVERGQKYLLLAHAIMNKFNNILNQMDISDINITTTHVINRSFMSLLHLSIFFNNWEAFQCLFKVEKDLEEWNNDINENTVLHTACKVSDSKYINALCKEGTFSTEYLNKTNHKGLSPFHCLCSVDSDEWFNEVINRPGLKFELACKKGNTPFILSVIAENIILSEILFSKGANVDYQNKSGFSAIHYACMKNSYECVQQLIDWNANIDLKNKFGLTPLCFAVRNDNREIVKLLIKQNADVNIADQNGWTVLHHAVKRNNIELLKYLLENGAKASFKNKKHHTPLGYAYSHNNLKAVSVIKPYERKMLH